MTVWYGPPLCAVWGDLILLLCTHSMFNSYYVESAPASFIMLTQYTIAEASYATETTLINRILTLPNTHAVTPKLRPPQLPTRVQKLDGRRTTHYRNILL